MFIIYPVEEASLSLRAAKIMSIYTELIALAFI